MRLEGIYYVFLMRYFQYDDGDGDDWDDGDDSDYDDGYDDDDDDGDGLNLIHHDWCLRLQSDRKQYIFGVK